MLIISSNPLLADYCYGQVARYNLSMYYPDFGIRVPNLIPPMGMIQTQSGVAPYIPMALVPIGQEQNMIQPEDPEYVDIRGNIERNNDMNYANYLMNYTPAFMELIQIMYLLYEGATVFLLIDPSMEDIVETLCKFIQQRYACNANRIESLEDLELAVDSQFDNIIGINNLDVDKERYSLIQIQMGVNNGQQFISEGDIPSSC